jgi:glycolate oxidase FAD binding subunit
VGLGHDDGAPRYDLALDLTGLDAIVEYDPEDLTLTAQCGVTVAALRERVAARGQELPLEAARAALATLGGTLAANTSGARRLRFGAPRDRILGARFVLGDGTAARSGGKVVKNVAGYGLHRLLCGSRGGLGVILEASLKLMPAPETRRALVFGTDAAALRDPARWSRLPRLEPAVLTALGAAAAAETRLEVGAPFAIVAGFEDERAWVERQEAAVRAALGEPRARLEDAAVTALWQALADLEDREGAALTLTTAANTPAALAPLLDQPEATGLVFHATAGRLLLPAAPERAATLVRDLATADFALIEAHGVGTIAPALASQEGVRALRERIRAALDPGATMALGERWVAAIA